LYAWEFEKGTREMRVRVEGQLVFNAPAQMLNAALAGFGLAYVPEDLVQKHLAKGGLIRVLADWCPAFFGLPPLLPEPPAIHAGLRLAGRCVTLPGLKQRNRQ
jgi:DNA-binding transcriptional LysR family regulator